MTVPGLRHAAVLVAAVAVVSLAACGGNSAASSEPTTGESTAGQPSAAGPSSSTGAGSAHPVDVCVTVNAASAAQLSGQPITTATAISEQAPDEYGCAYSSADDSVQVEVQVSEHDAASSYGTFLAGSPGASTVGGLGDKAFFDNERTMYVLAGNNLIQVNGLNTADESAALARPILAAL
jgi:hypothetical protein